MARKPALPRLARFSPTRLNLYRFCPRAYAFQYDQGLRWGGQSAAQSLGGSLHRTLQTFHDRGGAEAVSPEALKAALTERWSQAGYSSHEEAAASRALGEEILDRYHQAAREPGRETLATEVTVQRRYDTFVLFGKIDRLDRRPDGALEVIDYKSGRYVYTEDDVRESLAMTVYQLLVSRENPGVAVYTGILNLRTGDGAFVLRTEDELDVFEREVRALVGTITDDAVKAPVPGEQCRRCPYPSVCPEGRAWLRAND
jgi:RecB family exonuclease